VGIKNKSEGEVVLENKWWGVIIAFKTLVKLQCFAWRGTQQPRGGGEGGCVGV